jgi:hypothetical protein
MYFLHSSVIPAGEGICLVLCRAYVSFFVGSYMNKRLKTVGYGLLLLLLLLLLIKHICVINRLYLKLTFHVLSCTVC